MKGIGLIGCGTISEVYLRNASQFKDITFVACADLNPEAAKATATAHGIEACSVERLLVRDEIEIVLNLTVPRAHAEVALAALDAGKHVYNEKPLATYLDEGKRILEAAAIKGLRVGCAPDTVLGPAVQVARKLVESGEIGQALLGGVAIMSHGMEMWHPNPEFFYKAGAGPVLDMGPYAIATLATLLGPISSVMASGKVGNPVRTITTPNSKYRGQTFKVETMTTVQALLEFASGAQVSFTASWDVWNHSRAPIEIHGTDGSLLLPDLNWFGGDVMISRRNKSWEAIPTNQMIFGANNYESGSGTVANYRGLGLADMARSIEAGEPHRASGELGLHVLAVMEAILASAEIRQSITIDFPFHTPERLTEIQAASLLTGSRAPTCI